MKVIDAEHLSQSLDFTVTLQFEKEASSDSILY